jgi:anti-sigma-K factor RskA
VNRQELIESGKLELFVAGALCGKEAREVSSMIAADPVLQQEVRAIEETMIKVLTEGKMKPSPALKDRIMAEIKNTQAIPENAHDATLSLQPAGGRIVAMNNMNVWLAAASVALLLALSFTYYALNQKILLQQSELGSLKDKYNNQLASDSKFTEQLALINHQNTKKVILNGVAASPNSKAIVYWNNLNGRVIINPTSLPAPPTGKQYQLWALLDGKPVDAGVFDITNDSIKLQEVKNITNAQAFAVTLEQKGGVTSPTLTAMYVMGSI